jgi:poly(hydroxyalkanoate) depolymerase family esterase
MGTGRAVRSPLLETTNFGSDPGNLRMFSFVPESLRSSPALVVVLHGCGQNAARYDLGAGWSTLAKHYGFALLMPEQQPSNNANRCFNWFNPEDSKRERNPIR